MTDSTLLLSSDSVLLSLLHQRDVLVLSTPSEVSTAENRHWQIKCPYSNQSHPIKSPCWKVCNEVYIESYLCLLDRTYMKRVQHFCGCCSYLKIWLVGSVTPSKKTGNHSKKKLEYERWFIYKQTVSVVIHWRVIQKRVSLKFTELNF